MQSPDHLHIAMDYERDMDNLKEDESPPNNLLLKNISETIHNVYQKTSSSHAIHKVDYTPTVKYVNKPRSSTPSDNFRKCDAPNKSSSTVNTTRLNEQCAGCKCWGHKVSSCVCIAQHVWSARYIKQNPSYCSKLADEFARHNSEGGRKSLVKILNSVSEISIDKELFNDSYNSLDFELNPSSHPIPGV